MTAHHWKRILYQKPHKQPLFHSKFFVSCARSGKLSKSADIQTNDCAYGKTSITRSKPPKLWKTVCSFNVLHKQRRKNSFDRDGDTNFNISIGRNFFVCLFVGFKEERLF